MAADELPVKRLVGMGGPGARQWEVGPDDHRGMGVYKSWDRLGN